MKKIKTISITIAILVSIAISALPVSAATYLGSKTVSGNSNTVSSTFTVPSGDEIRITAERSTGGEACAVSTYGDEMDFGLVGDSYAIIDGVSFDSNHTFADTIIVSAESVIHADGTNDAAEFRFRITNSCDQRVTLKFYKR